MVGPAVAGWRQCGARVERITTAAEAATVQNVREPQELYDLLAVVELRVVLQPE
jgi:hypothetical protein